MSFGHADGQQSSPEQVAPEGVRVTFLNYTIVPPDVRSIQEAWLPTGWVFRRIEGLPLAAAVDRLVTEAADSQALLVDYDVDRSVIDALPQLKLIQIIGVGYDSIDVRYAAERGIPVCNAPGLNAVAVAEFTFGLALSVARRLNILDAAVRAGKWPQYSYRSRSVELYGKTWGVVGFGNIGREVARRARAFGMRALYYDPIKPKPEAESEGGASYVELDQLIEQSDILSLHVPLTPQTRHLISESTLRRMKPSAILISTSRGATVDTRALAAALAEGQIAGAGLDVFEQEPPARDDPLLALDNVVLTPHTAAGTRDTIARVFSFCFENVARVASGFEPRNQVN